MMNCIFLVCLTLVTFLTPSSSLECSTLDPKQIQLITFDVFAALMDTPTSLQQNIGKVIPELKVSDRVPFVTQWLTDYANEAGHTFSQPPQPFVYVIRTSLIKLLSKYGLSTKYIKGTYKFNQIVNIWGQLIPRPHTQDVLLRLQNAGYQLGVLSNGDHKTLSNAVSVFLPKVQIKHIFSSDYPVGAFKPHPKMYQQISQQGWDINKVLHIAGSPMDAQGARYAGLYSGLLHYQPLADHPPCFALDDINKLPAQLKLPAHIRWYSSIVQRIHELYDNGLHVNPNDLVIKPTAPNYGGHA